MSELGDAINEVRTELASAASEFMFDLCDLIPDPSLVAQGAGHTLTDSAAVTSIPCTHKQLGGGGVRIDDGESVVTKTHKVTLPYTSDTVLIDRHYQIRIHARGFNPQVIFEQPVRQVDSASPFVSVLVTMTEGFRSPGTI